MKVLIDLTSLADNFSGIERFALEITKVLIADQTRDDIEYILVFKNEVHREFAIRSNNVRCIVVNGKNKLIFNQIKLPLRLASIKADYYFFPAFPAPYFFFNRNAIWLSRAYICNNYNLNIRFYYTNITILISLFGRCYDICCSRRISTTNSR